MKKKIEWFSIDPVNKLIIPGRPSGAPHSSRVAIGSAIYSDGLNIFFITFLIINKITAMEDANQPLDIHTLSAKVDSVD